MNSFIIATFCAQSILLPSNACGPTTEAFMKQVGFYQDVEMVQGYVTTKAHHYTPSYIETVGGYGLAAYKVSKGQEAKVGFKIPDFCDRLEFGGSKTTQSMSIRWNF